MPEVSELFFRQFQGLKLTCFEVFRSYMNFVVPTCILVVRAHNILQRNSYGPKAFVLVRETVTASKFALFVARPADVELFWR